VTAPKIPILKATVFRLEGLGQEVPLLAVPDVLLNACKPHLGEREAVVRLAGELARQEGDGPYSLTSPTFGCLFAEHVRLRVDGRELLVLVVVPEGALGLYRKTGFALGPVRRIDVGAWANAYRTRRPSA